jgi:hypothetical protein
VERGVDAYHFSLAWTLLTIVCGGIDWKHPFRQSCSLAPHTQNPAKYPSILETPTSASRRVLPGQGERNPSTLYHSHPFSVRVIGILLPSSPLSERESEGERGGEREKEGERGREVEDYLTIVEEDMWRQAHGL